MTERALIGQQAREFCDDLWQRGDFWDFESSEYERARCARLLTILAGRRYARALEIGCGAGYFTRLLAGIADQIVAFDIAPAAIARARTLGPSPRSSVDQSEGLLIPRSQVRILPGALYQAESAPSRGRRVPSMSRARASQHTEAR